MRKFLRQLLFELVWLAVVLLLTYLLCKQIIGRTESDSVDIHLHDTYFVIAARHVRLTIFLIITFFLYFIKEAFRSFRVTLSNVILFVAGLTLVVGLAIVNKEFLRLSSNTGWTMYPPLSALKDKTPEVRYDPATTIISNGILILQLLVTSCLLIASYCWGRKRKAANRGFAPPSADKTSIG